MKGKFYTKNWDEGKEYFDEGETISDNVGELSYEYNGTSCTFDIDGFPAQCGASIIFAFSFSGRISNAKLYEMGVAFAQDLKKMRFDAGAKLLASSVVGSPLHHLLNNNYWWKGTERRNHNSRNRIAIFELDLRDN